MSNPIDDYNAKAWPETFGSQITAEDSQRLMDQTLMLRRLGGVNYCKSCRKVVKFPHELHPDGE